MTANVDKSPSLKRTAKWSRSIGWRIKMLIFLLQKIWDARGNVWETAETDREKTHEAHKKSSLHFRGRAKSDQMKPPHSSAIITSIRSDCYKFVCSYRAARCTCYCITDTCIHRLNTTRFRNNSQKIHSANGNMCLGSQHDTGFRVLPPQQPLHTA